MEIRQLPGMRRCAGDAPSSFCFSHFLSSPLLSVYLSVSARSSLPPSRCLQVTLSACVRVRKRMCVRGAGGTNECLYSAEATGRRIGGQGLPSRPSNPTPPHCSYGQGGSETPPPSICPTSWSTPLLLPIGRGWCKVSGKRRKRRGGLERAEAGAAPGGEERPPAELRARAAAAAAHLRSLHARMQPVCVGSQSCGSNVSAEVTFLGNPVRLYARSLRSFPVRLGGVVDCVT